MLTFTVVAPKGGVGKTTLTANLGGLLRDFGFRVLLIDADVQPSLSKYFDLTHVAVHGVTKLVSEGFLTQDCISRVRLPFGESGFKGVGELNPAPDIDIVLSDTREGKLQDWLGQRLDRLVRISMALNQEAVASAYDFAIIDTQGATCRTQRSTLRTSSSRQLRPTCCRRGNSSTARAT